MAAIPPIAARNCTESRPTPTGIALDEVGAVSSTRIVVPGATTAITRRATLRKAFLAPWHAMVEQSWLYALADAQRVLGFQVHHGVRVVSHHHLSITLGADNLGEVLRRFHHDVSCAINTLLAHERYDAPRNIFDGREAHCMRLLDASAQASHLTYEYLNPVAAGLVAQPDHMPGTALDWGHWKSGGLVVRRPDVYFSDQRPEELRLELSPPPLLMQAFDGDLDGLVHHMRRLSDHGCRALRDSRRGRAPLGAQRLVRMHPWNEPKTLAEPGGRVVPSFKVGTTGLMGRRTRCEAAREVRGFRIAHEHARRSRLAGNNAAEFPYGTYAMRRFHGVPVAEPHSEAIVARPGPTLNDVLAAIGEQRAAHQAPPCREPTLGADNLGEVLRRFHRDVSCAINVPLARERYDAPRNVFDGRESHWMRLLDASAQASHLTYEYLNPLAAALVALPDHMPGTVLDWGHRGPFLLTSRSSSLRLPGAFETSPAVRRVRGEPIL
jgi:putative transposase